MARFAYADPPYIGLAKSHYGKHPDYAGEVDHGELIARLEADYDGWALSLSMKSLPVIAKLVPDDVLTLSWVKPIAPPWATTATTRGSRCSCVQCVGLVPAT